MLTNQWLSGTLYLQVFPPFRNEKDENIADFPTEIGKWQASNSDKQWENVWVFLNPKY